MAAALALAARQMVRIGVMEARARATRSIILLDAPRHADLLADAMAKQRQRD